MPVYYHVTDRQQATSPNIVTGGMSERTGKDCDGGEAGRGRRNLQRKETARCDMQLPCHSDYVSDSEAGQGGVGGTPDSYLCWGRQS